jgi:hypothetical protein
VSRDNKAMNSILFGVQLKNFSLFVASLLSQRVHIVDEEMERERSSVEVKKINYEIEIASDRFVVFLLACHISLCYSHFPQAEISFSLTHFYTERN